MGRGQTGCSGPLLPCTWPLLGLGFPPARLWREAGTLSRIPQGNSSRGFHQQAETGQWPGGPCCPDCDSFWRCFQRRRNAGDLLTGRVISITWSKQWVGTLPGGPSRSGLRGPDQPAPSPSSAPGAASPARLAQGPGFTKVPPHPRPGATGLWKLRCFVGLDAFKDSRVYF